MNLTRLRERYGLSMEKIAQHAYVLGFISFLKKMGFKGAADLRLRKKYFCPPEDLK